MSVFFSNHKKMIIFDLNGTLIDEKAGRKAAFIEALSQFTGRWSPDDNQPDLEQIYQLYEKEQRRRRRRQPSTPLRKLRIAAVKKAMRPLPVAADDKFVDNFFRMTAELQKEQIQLYPDAVPTLERLAPHYKLGIISNSRGYDIAGSQLSPFFTEELIMTPDKAGRRKPDPRFYHAALKLWQIKAEECVMIGNSWRNDMTGAAKAGMDGIWIRKRQQTRLVQRKINRKKVIAVRSLGQILEILDQPNRPEI